MAGVRFLTEGKAVPLATFEPVVMAGRVNDCYTLAIGDLRITLTPGERAAIVETWERLEQEHVE